MPRPATAALRRPAAGRALARHCRVWLLQVWQRLTLDADERYIRGARDLAELERRLQRVARSRPDRSIPIHPGA